LLNAIGVGHPQCDRVVQLSAQHGGLAAKITGGGGGGCVITLLRDGEAGSAAQGALVADLAAEGTFECFEAVVGDEGVKLHSPEIEPTSSL